MTRVYTDGFEGGDIIHYTIVQAGPSATTAQKNTGNYSLVLNNSGAISIYYPFTTAMSEFYWRSWVRFENSSAAMNVVVFKTTTTNVVSITKNTTNQFEVRANNVVKATTTFTPVVNTWYMLELHAKIDAAVGVLELKIDGVSRAVFNGATNGGGASINRMYFEQTTFVNQLWFDDMAVNDTNGSVDNSWCGDGRVAISVPTATGTYNMWSSSGSTPPWAAVDEIPTNNDTDYAFATGSNMRSSFRLQTPAFPTGSIITHVWSEMVSRSVLADAPVVNMFIVATTGTFYDSASGRTLASSYNRYMSAPWATNPMSSGAWTYSDIANLEAGVESV